MQAPMMMGAHRVAPDTISLSSYFPLPGLGILPVNAFVIEAAQPVLVDTGLSALREPFLAALRRTIDPAAIRWIWLSHMDADHLGNLEEILTLAPHAKVVTNFLGMGKMMLRHFDVSRVHLLEPGTTIDAGDRTLVPLKPAYYDAPETVGFRHEGPTGPRQHRRPEWQNQSAAVTIRTEWSAGTPFLRRAHACPRHRHGNARGLDVVLCGYSSGREVPEHRT